jgi:hypothetical protein
MALAAAGVGAQSVVPGNPALATDHAEVQKRLSARFLAERGIGRGRGQAGKGRDAPQTLASVRTQHRALANSANTSLTAPWQPVGPAQVTTASFGAVTGRVTSISADPADTTGNTVYIGTTGGGVWKSTTAASANASSASFAPLTDATGAFQGSSAVSLSIGAVSVQPGGTGVVLAGTGDPNDATDSYYGAGILRSTDKGLTWSLIQNSVDASSGGSENFSFTGNSFAGFAWSATTSGLVVAAVSQAAEGIEVEAPKQQASMMGIYYSEDAGQSWRMAIIEDGPAAVVQSNQTEFTTAGNAATAVVWNPVRQMFFAAVRYHGYYQSPDGVTWTRLANQPGVNLTATMCPTNEGSTGSPACPILRGALAVQPVTGDTFAITVDVNNLDQGLWRDVCNLASGVCASSTVAFGTQIGDGALESTGNTTIPEADYDLYLAAAPYQGDTLLFAGTTDIYRCSLAAGCVWRNTTHAATCASAEVAWSQHAVDTTFGAQGLLYFGNDGGVWRSTDAVNQQAPVCSADDAAHYQNLNPGFTGSLAEVEDLALDAQNSQNMMVSLGSLGTAAPQGAAAGAPWPQVLDGEGNFAAIDPVTAANWYATSEFGVSLNACNQGSTCTVADFGVQVIGNTQVGGDGEQQTIPAPWILDPQNPANVIIGTCRVWRGPVSGGSSWSASNLLSPMLDTDQGPFCNGNAEIRTLAASGYTAQAAGAPERIYAGMAGELDGGATVPGHVYTSTVTSSSGGSTTTWIDLFHSPVASPSGTYAGFNPQGFDISSIFVDPHDPSGQTVYVTIQGFWGTSVGGASIYASNSGGSAWNNITSNLPNAPVNSVVVDPNNANIVYVATDAGVYVTTNVLSCFTADCWDEFGTSLPNAPVTQLAVFNSGAGSLLRAATYGRGVWQLGLVTSGTTLAAATATPASLTFAPQQAQTVSAPQSVVITNTGTIALTISQLLASGEFDESDNCAQQAIAPGHTCAAQVVFAPTAAGALTGTLTVYANITGGQLTVPLNGTGLGAAAVVLQPSSVSFPATAVGQTSAAQNITISNTGGTTVTLDSITVSGNFAIAANTCGGSLAANTGCTVGVTFTPASANYQSGALTVIDTAGTQTAELSGTGQSPATDSLAPASLVFAAQVIGTVSAAQQVTLTNNGDQALALISTRTSPGFNGVNQCGATLAGHASCAIEVSYIPTAIGAQTGTLTVTDAIRSQTVVLSGAGTAPAGVSATPATLSFGDYGVGQTSPAKTVTMTNNGGVALTGMQITVSGDFAMSAGNGACGATLAAGASCEISVSFSPTQAGVLSGTLTIVASELAAPEQVSLTGNGEDFTLTVSGSSSAVVTNGQMATFQLLITPVNGSTGTVALACTGAPANATCTVNPISVAMTGLSTVTATVTFATGQTTTAQANRPALWLRATAAFAVVLPMGFLAGRRRRWRGIAPVLAAFALLGLAPLLFLGCGLGVTPGSTTGTTPLGPVTPVGAYTLTITGTAPGLSHAAQVTVTVQ